MIFRTVSVWIQITFRSDIRTGSNALLTRIKDLIGVSSALLPQGRRHPARHCKVDAREPASTRTYGTSYASISAVPPFPEASVTWIV